MMAHIAPWTDLAHAPNATVRFGTAPDGLPWLLRSDRSARLQALRTSVLGAFELGDWQLLPERIRTALDKDVASGLMGIHEARLRGPSTAARSVYVSRRSVRGLVGPSLLSQILAPTSPTEVVGSSGTQPITSAAVGRDDGTPVADTRAERIEESIRQRSTQRRLLLDLGDDSTWIGDVAKENRALRAPTAPYRPMVCELLTSIPGAVARVGDTTDVPIADRTGYERALRSAARGTAPPPVAFVVPEASVVDLLIGVARRLGQTHAEGMVHGDVTPGNLLLDGPRLVPIDSLSVRAGDVAAAATFEWAAPEQVAGLPIDARSDVFSLAHMLVELVGGVRFGEECVLVVPVGADGVRRVSLLKGTGVFIDTTDRPYDRAWQRAWQSLLSRCVAYDPERRPADGKALADAVAEVAQEHPLQGTRRLRGDFGTLVPMEAGGPWPFARLSVDE